MVVHKHSSESGFSLIEALVSLLILSLGLLGVVGMHLTSFRFQQGSWARDALTTMATDFGERMRANPSSTATAYNLTTSYSDQRKELDAGSVVVVTDCESTTCTEAQLASYDVVKWRLWLNQQLPGSAAYITGDRNTGYQATIMWFDKDFLTSDGLPGTTATCAAADTGMSQRTCCPKNAKAVDGVRCINLTVLP